MLDKIGTFAENNRGKKVSDRYNNAITGKIVGWHIREILIYCGTEEIKIINTIIIHRYGLGHLFITENDYENYDADIKRRSIDKCVLIFNKDEISNLIKALEL